MASDPPDIRPAMAAPNVFEPTCPAVVDTALASPDLASPDLADPGLADPGLAGDDPSAAGSYEHRIEVQAEDIDELGHVNNTVYLKWVQAAVIEHWRRVAPREVVATHLWVALRHEISYRHPGFVNDNLVVEVVLKKLQGARAFYRSLITRGDELLAEVDSSWCCLDSITRKPVRVAREVVAKLLPKGVARQG